MKIQLPILHQEMKDGSIVSHETMETFDLDTSVYSEERWEQNFPEMANREGLFQYIERIQKNAVSDRVKVACMLKAIFCFLESEKISQYKDFAKMFNLAAPDYTENLINRLKSAFQLILGSSSVKN